MKPKSKKQKERPSIIDDILYRLVEEETSVNGKVLTKEEANKFVETYYDVILSLHSLENDGVNVFNEFAILGLIEAFYIRKNFVLVSLAFGDIMGVVRPKNPLLNKKGFESQFLKILNVDYVGHVVFDEDMMGISFTAWNIDNEGKATNIKRYLLQSVRTL